MDQNSLKHTDSGNPELLSIRWLREWLLKDCVNNRSAQVLSELAEQTEKCLLRGNPPPFCEMEVLREVIVSQVGGRVSDLQPVAKWLPRSQLEKWWRSREAARTDQLLSKGLTHRPELITQAGGGRGNQNRFCFSFAEIADITANIDAPADEASSDSLRYSEESLKAVFWLRWLLPGYPVKLSSWRGWVVLGNVMFGFLIMVSSSLLTLWSVNHPGPVSGTDISLILLSGIIVLGTYITMRPWLNLPEQRITIASDHLLPSDQLYGQLRLIRNKEKKRSGWLSLVRYSSTCTTCAGTVELSDGRADFPGRIIGRCRESPMEHVFSFDPVSLSGYPLRPLAVPKAHGTDLISQ